MAVKIQLRGDTAANWAVANPILAEREIVLETDTDQFKIGNGVDSYGSLPYGGITGPSATGVIQDFGNGEDGDVVITAGITTLTQDMYYNTLTISGTGQIRTNGFRVFVKNNLDLSNAGVAAITLDGLFGLAATTQLGAIGGTAYPAGTLGVNTAGGTGAAGVVGVGVAAAAAGATTPSNGGGSGASGAGGSGSTGAGGISRAGSTATLPLDFARFTYDIIRGVVLVQGGAGGPGGSSGSGDGVALGRAGGGGGAGGGVVYVAAKNVIKSSSTASGAISSKGGAGGNGASAVAGNTGGGGGAGGGGGGYVILFYENLFGPVITDLINCSGGDGGIGGAGFGTGTGGNGGTGGTGGRIRRHRTFDQTGGTTVGSVGAVGSSGIGLTGGAAGAGGLCKLSI
jgi:hypothetical protein